MIYEDAAHYYPYVRERWGANPPEFGYKDIIPEFTAENWDPGEWAAFFAWPFEIVTDTEQHHPKVIVNDADRALTGTKKVDLE